MEPSIGILGGVGPQAGCLLHQHVLDEIEKQSAPKTDQGFLPILHFSLSAWISDRTEFLTQPTTCQNPALGAYQVAQMMSEAAKTGKLKLWVGIPCNTFHAPEIFNKLESLITFELKNIKLVHLLHEVKHFLQKSYLTQPQKTIGLLSTTGTRQAQIYQKALQPLGFEIVQVPDNMQDKVHEAIYHPNWGIKSAQHNSQKTKALFEQFAHILIAQGAKAIILGCTEIPIAFKNTKINGITLIDPTQILGKALVKKALADRRNKYD